MFTESAIPAAAGLVMALAAGMGAHAAGLDRDRALYPVVTIVIACLYGLFAAIDGAAAVIGTETVFIVPFVVAALLGFRRNLWLVVVALACHGLYDFVHPAIVANRGVPSWWPVFCLAYDVAAALYLAWLLRRARIPAHRTGAPAA